jgi:hypothetical protein
MFSCKQAARLLSELYDRKLTLRERMRLRFHLVICRFCRGFARDLHLFEAAVRIYSQKIDSDTVAPQATLHPEARQRILHATESDGR